jgi:O-antigen/teichoic acid export membrane protein
LALLTSPRAARQAASRFSFIAATGLVFAATAVSSGLLYGASVVASRWLGAADYGIVGAMLGLTVILTVPAFTIQLLAARAVALTRDDPSNVARVLRDHIRLGVTIGLPVTLVGIAFSGPIAELLNAGSRWPVVVTVAITLPLLLTTAARGVLQGQGRYVAMAGNMIWEGLGLVAVIAMIAFGGGTTGVCAAPAISVIVSMTAGALAFRHDLRGSPPGGKRGLRAAGVIPTGVFLAAFAVLTNTDVLVAKHALGDVAAGEYAAAALFGKIVLFIPIAVGLVLISEAAARTRVGRDTRRLFWLSFALVFGSCGALVLIAYLAPGVVAALTVGGGYPGAEDLFGPYAVAMTGFALVNVVGAYSLALGLSVPAMLCAAAAPAQVAAQVVVRDSAPGLIWSMVWVAAAVTVAALAVTLTKARSLAGPVLPVGHEVGGPP